MTTMTASEIELVTLADIESAARGLAGVATRTPLLLFDTITERIGVPVFVKPEMLQRGGAFKFRGAFTYLSRLAPAARERGVIAPSSGNHAQAVALAAKLFGVPATVVMPTTVTHAKRVGAERLGARIVLAGTTTSERYEKALELAHLEGSTLVPPYDDPAIIAGQGTVGLEIASDAPQVGTVIVQVGGGGLSAGAAVFGAGATVTRSDRGSTRQTSFGRPSPSRSESETAAPTVEIHPEICRSDGSTVRTLWTGGGYKAQLQINTDTTLGPSTTIAAGSNAAVLPQPTISVASTVGFLSAGSFQITLTSGATTDACARALLRAKAAQVDVLVFARVVDRHRAPI